MVLRPNIRLRHVHAGGTRRPEAPVIPEGHPRMARSALLNVMVQAAFKAGKGLSRDFGEVQNLQVSLKGPGDYVSQADRKAERLLREERSEEHTSELQSRENLVCRLLLEKKKNKKT